MRLTLITQKEKKRKDGLELTIMKPFRSFLDDCSWRQVSTWQTHDSPHSYNRAILSLSLSFTFYASFFIRFYFANFNLNFCARSLTRLPIIWLSRLK